MGANAEACEARNEDGKTCYVPADMNYRKWEKPKILMVKKHREQTEWKIDYDYLLKNKTVDIERKIVYNVIAKLMNFYLKGLIW